jgi:hypothetical protein
LLGKTGGPASPLARRSLGEGGRRRWQKGVSEQAKQKLKFIAVENFDEALAVALEKKGRSVPLEEQICVSTTHVARGSNETKLSGGR